MRGRRATLPGLLLPLLCTCTGPATPTVDRIPAPVAESGEAAVVRAFVRAFNEHDIGAMLERVSVDVAWYGVDGGGVRVDAAGREALAAAMREYFRGLPSARSELLRVESLGPWVTTHERASWESDGGSASQASVAVYEVRDGLIRAVWYFPAVR